MKKAQRVIASANGANPPWEYETEESGDLYTLTLTRGEETMQITWDTAQNDTLIHPLSYSLAGVRETKLRNVSAAMKIIEGKPNYTARRRKVAAPQPAGEPEEDIKPLPLPFDPEESSDRDIVKALTGKRIVWKNRMLGIYESGVVPPRVRVEVKDGNGGFKTVLRTSRNIRMATTTAGRRVITFPAVNEQFRSVGLDQIVQVV